MLNSFQFNTWARLKYFIKRKKSFRMDNIFLISFVVIQNLMCKYLFFLAYFLLLLILSTLIFPHIFQGLFKLVVSNQRICVHIKIIYNNVNSRVYTSVHLNLCPTCHIILVKSDGFPNVETKSVSRLLSAIKNYFYISYSSSTLFLLFE